MSFFKQYSQPIDNVDLRVISLGAGVQSSVMALMASRGEIGPMPDCAIFADTKAEPKAVYEHLAWLEKQLTFPVYRASAGSLKDDCIEGRNTTGQTFASLPFFLNNGAMARRQCTSEYKIKPIQKKIRELLGLKSGERSKAVVEQWIGISLDEFQRMKKSGISWIHNRWPLLEREIKRSDCENWFVAYYPGRSLSKSACIFCPYRNQKTWLDLTEQEFSEACEFDELIRESTRMPEKQFLHRQCIPLRDVDFSNAEDHGQINWLDECDGMCGV